MPPQPLPASRRLGEDALSFARWFTKSRFALMEGFLADLEANPSESDIAEHERRFLEAIRHAKRVMRARLVVTVLLVAGVVATVASSLARAIAVPAPIASDVEATLRLLDVVAAIAGSATLALVGLRLAFDRYLDLIDTSATYLAILIASARR